MTRLLYKSTNHLAQIILNKDDGTILFYAAKLMLIIVHKDI
ncbi:hypothetical protein N9I86_06405 [Hyphomicrobiales bacterium]|nr:hypothetical protein [Hyphomicrobiales bacterium]